MTDPQRSDETTTPAIGGGDGGGGGDLAETALVEEVSIDGMCGVY